MNAAKAGTVLLDAIDGFRLRAGLKLADLLTPKQPLVTVPRLTVFW